MNMTSLALAIGEAYGTVAGVVYGNRVNQPVRAKIAGFLGLPVEELFDRREEDEDHRLENDKDHRLEACATGAGVSHG
jgi:hypothetical protein